MTMTSNYYIVVNEISLYNCGDKFTRSLGTS